MLDKMFEDLKDIAELKDFAEAQHRTILTQSKRIGELENEIIHLKDMLSHTTPIIGQTFLSENLISTKDEESIAKMELKKLRDISLARELTMEEARKVEIYTKILYQLNTADKKKANDGKNKSTEELLKLIDEQSSGS